MRAFGASFVTLAYPILIVVSCSSLNAVAIAAEDNWTTIETPYCWLNYKEIYSADVKKVNEYLQHAVTEIVTEFSTYEADKLLRSANCNIYLHPIPNDQASESRALVYTGVRDGKYFAELHFLTPSAYDSEIRTDVGSIDDNYFFKTFVHEYSTIILERITMNKSKGWDFFNAPRWFIQGYEEYLGLMHSSEYNRDVLFERYLQLLEKDPLRIDLDFGIQVKDAYVDGCILLVFMHDTFGKIRVQSILASQADTFGKAIKSALGVDLAAFSEKFERWKKSRINLEPSTPISNRYDSKTGK